MTPREYVLRRLVGFEPLPPLREFLAAEVERHKVVEGTTVAGDRDVWCLVCPSGDLTGDQECPFVTRLAASLGYEGGGPGTASPEESESRVAPGQRAGAERSASSGEAAEVLGALYPGNVYVRPPSAEAAEPHAEGERGAIDTCGACGGRRWVEDECWEPDDRATWRGRRTEGNGLIPCGNCNLGGWSTPQAPALPAPVSAPAQGVGE